jgi:hypothetical protein
MLSFLQRLPTYLLQLARYVSGPLVVWGTAVVILGVIAWRAFWPSDWEVTLRYTGLVFEWMGVMTVAWGLKQSRRLFKRQSFMQEIVDHYAAFPKWRVKSVVGHLSARAALAGGTALGFLSARISKDAPIEQRLDALETHVETLSNLVHAARHDVENKFRTQKGALDEERRERTTGDTSIRKLIDEAVAGGLTLEVTGVVWLVLGLVLANASTELAKLF